MGGSGGLQGDDQNKNGLGWYIEPSGATAVAIVAQAPKNTSVVGG